MLVYYTGMILEAFGTPIDIKIQPASGSYDNEGFEMSDEELKITSTVSQNCNKLDADKVVLLITL